MTFSQLFMMGICVYLKCAKAHLNTPMCYIVICIQSTIKIVTAKGELPKKKKKIPNSELPKSWSARVPFPQQTRNRKY